MEVEFTVAVNTDVARGLIMELRQILEDLGVADKMKIDES
jgi:hypothetical protein